MSWPPTANGIVPRVKTILVVDDERHIVDLVRLYLERDGFAVVSAGNGDEALAAAARHDPDLVILDLMLPGRDGFDVCRELRGAWWDGACRERRATRRPCQRRAADDPTGSLSVAMAATPPSVGATSADRRSAVPIAIPAATTMATTPIPTTDM